MTGFESNTTIGQPPAIRWIKRALNQWLRQAALNSFDYSLALEMMGFFGADIRECLSALQEKRASNFPSAR